MYIGYLIHTDVAILVLNTQVKVKRHSCQKKLPLHDSHIYTYNKYDKNEKCRDEFGIDANHKEKQGMSDEI